MADIVLCNDSGAFLINDLGEYIRIGGETPDTIPAVLAMILQARVLAQDPEAGAIYYGSTAPVGQPEGSVWTTGSGSYYVLKGDIWEPLPVFLPDVFYGSGPTAYGAARRALLLRLSRLTPENWVVSFNAGGQSTSFASFADVKTWIDDRIAMLDALGNRRAGPRFGYVDHTPEGAI